MNETVTFRARRELPYHAPSRADVEAMTDRVVVETWLRDAQDQQIRLETLLQWKEYEVDKREGMIGALIWWKVAQKDLARRLKELIIAEGRAKGDAARLQRQKDAAGEGEAAG